ncbi:MAG: lysylphosphatidylglycerol synthase transmembrane domain-containing protein [Firmicutes bacterium]|nr:lysylphosphatidylglycerol synthase transmembrane domain-containing protein [Bacillota bacterium]
MKRPSCNKLMLWGLLFAALVGLTVCFLNRQYSLASVISSIKTADPLWLIPGVLAMGLFFVCEGVNIGNCLRLAGHDVSLLSEIRYAMTGFFFSSITPSASGGQPMQLYFMRMDGLPVSHSSLALLTELTSFQAAAAALALAGLGARCSRVLGASTAAGTGGAALAGISDGAASAGGGIAASVFAAGILINAAVLAILLFLIFSPASIKIIVSPVLWAVDRFNPQKASVFRIKILRGVCEYRRASQYITKNPRAIARIFLTSVIQLLAYFSITFCVLQSLGITGISWGEATLSQAALYVAVSALPLPGAVGVTEGGFALLFASLVPSDLMGVAIILSRFVSFGLPLIASGMGTFLMGTGRDGRRQVAKHRKDDNLPHGVSSC